MTRRSRLLSIGLVGVLVASGCAGPDATPSHRAVTSSADLSAAPTALPSAAAATGGAYLALGDSLTFGIGVPRPQQNGYVARVAHRLEASEPPISMTRVFAVPGETASGFLERRLDDVVSVITDLGPRVALVTIGLGANELLQTRRAPACARDRASDGCQAEADAALRQAEDALETIVAGVQNALLLNGSDARVLLLAYYSPEADALSARTLVGSDGRVGCSATEDISGLNDRIACVADRRGTELVDLYAAFLGREDELTRIGGGDLHPNADGYGVIADEIVAVVLGG
jgi:lysophospholipase L1-like esterase